MTTETRTTEDVLNDAIRDVARAYRSAVIALADDILSEYPDAGDEELSDAIHEFVDGSRWAIITRQAFMTALISDNRDAFEGAGMLGECATQFDLDSAISTVAYYALDADVRDEITRRNDDV